MNKAILKKLQDIEKNANNITNLITGMTRVTLKNETLTRNVMKTEDSCVNTNGGLFEHLN